MASGKGINIYFPAELIQQIEDAGIDNLSAVCQEAIRVELEKATRKCSRCGSDLQPKQDGTVAQEGSEHR